LKRVEGVVALIKEEVAAVECAEAMGENSD